MTKHQTFRHRPFNSPLETGMRSLFLLDKAAPRFHDIQRLVYYDYLLVHSGDVTNGPRSLHPAIPHRSGEWLVRRNLILDGLDLMFAKELLVKRFDNSGINFGASDLTSSFLHYLTSDYANALRTSALWVIESFGMFSDENLAAYMISHLGRWGAEFKQESLVRGLPL